MYHFDASQLVYVTPCEVVPTPAEVVPDACSLATAPMVRHRPFVLQLLGHKPVTTLTHGACHDTTLWCIRGTLEVVDGCLFTTTSSHVRRSQLRPPYPSRHEQSPRPVLQTPAREHWAVTLWCNVVALPFAAHTVPTAHGPPVKTTTTNKNRSGVECSARIRLWVGGWVTVHSAVEHARQTDT